MTAASWRWRRCRSTSTTCSRELDDAPVDPIADALMPEGTRIGHVHLQVAELEQIERFYAGVLGFDVMVRGYPGALFVSAGGYHHHIGLNTWNSRGGSTPAFRRRRPARLRAAARRRRRRWPRCCRASTAAGVATEAAADGATLVRDPSGNGILLTRLSRSRQAGFTRSPLFGGSGLV